MTADRMLGRPRDPGSWNKYAYTRGDPINRKDPTGKYDCAVGAYDGRELTECEDFPIYQGGADPQCFALYQAAMAGDQSAVGLVDQYCPSAFNLPQQAGNGGGIDNPDDRSNALAAAVNLALEALKDPACASVFNTSGTGLHSPSEVLNALNGAESDFFVGSIAFLPLKADRIAEAEQSGYIGGQYTVANIAINTAPGYFFNEDIIGQVDTLLHELGHVFNLVASLGGSKIVYDANPDGSPNTAADTTNYDALYPCRTAAGLAMDQ